jgi:hypothetical protein
MEVQSKTLGSVLSTPKIGDPDGMVFVEFFTSTSQTQNSNSTYDPQNVNSALLQLGNYASASDAPGC